MRLYSTKLLKLFSCIAQDPRCFTALHGMPARTSDEKGVRLSVCLSVRPSVSQTRACDKTEERSVQIFIPYEKSFSIVFWEKK